jgi:hypothetical protein
VCSRVSPGRERGQTHQQGTHWHSPQSDAGCAGGGYEAFNPREPAYATFPYAYPAAHTAGPTATAYATNRFSVPATAVSFLGDAESSLGDAKSSLGDAETSLGDVQAPHTYQSYPSVATHATHSRDAERPAAHHGAYVQSASAAYTPPPSATHGTQVGARLASRAWAPRFGLQVWSGNSAASRAISLPKSLSIRSQLRVMPLFHQKQVQGPSLCP